MAASLSRFAPPLALMALVFFLSAQPDLGTDLGALDVILRKCAHMTAYGLLWLLWWRALGFGHPGPAIAIALAYAASDEYHQSLVQGRAGLVSDVLIDAAGIGLAGLAVVLRARRRRRAAEPAAALQSQPRSVA